LCLYGGRGAKTHEGSTGSPCGLCSDLPCRGRGPGQAVKGGAGPHPAAASTLDCRHRCAGRHRDGRGEQHGSGQAGGCTSRTLPKPSCLGWRRSSRLLEWPSGRSPGSASSTTTPTSSGCATPTRSGRVTGSRACVEDHRRPVTGGTYGSRCWRLGSPQSSREVPAETQEGPAGTGRGWGHSGKIGFRGSGDLGGGRREPGGLVWPLEVPVRDAVAHRLRPVGISAQAHSVTPGAGLAFRVPGTCIGRPSPNQQPSCTVYPSRASSLRSSLRDP
jgi:hypothetical protein